MEKEQIKELIQRARLSAQNEGVQELVNHFEVFFDLFSEKEKEEKNPDFMLKLDNSYRKFWDSFEKVAEQFGFTTDSLQAYFSNPSNFSPEQWRQMQAAQETVAAQKAPRSFPKRAHNPQKVRI